MAHPPLGNISPGLRTPSGGSGQHGGAQDGNHDGQGGQQGRPRSAAPGDKDVMEGQATRPRKAAAAQFMGSPLGGGKNHLQEAPPALRPDDDLHRLALELTQSDT